MTTTTTFLDALVDALIAAGVYNRNDQIAPAAVLWTDKERQWIPLLPQLRQRLTLLTLGDYDPDSRTGPAYYLRCLIAGTLADRLPDGSTLILYLPGYSRQDLRAVEESPKPLQPLAELQYRGVLWTHANGRDWTVAGFLQNKEGGLGIPVAGDNATREAMQRALVALADEPVAGLRAAAPLRAEFFNSLLSPDIIQHLLRWLNDPSHYANHLEPAVWAAFRSQCQSIYGFDPETTEALAVVDHLTDDSGPWATVWQRYEEAPERYPNLPPLLEQQGPAQLSFFKEERTASYFPQVNADAESVLREKLLSLDNALPGTVRSALLDLEQKHAHRRGWVWATLGQAPLASALAPLATLAEATQEPLGGTSINAIITAYVADGWKVDRAVLDALAAVSAAIDVVAVRAALLPIYRSWLKGAATALQKALAGRPNAYQVSAPPALPPGTCLLFCDALRYDVGHRLHERLQQAGHRSAISWRLSALPPVTATAKPAVSPVAAEITGSEPSLTPVARESGSTLRIDVLRRLLAQHGIQDLVSRGNLGDPSGRAWDEQGAVDQYGHQHGWLLAHHVRDEVERLVDRIEMLLDHGWQEVVVVTDHGWLLLPGGLPKAELPAHLTVERKGRCAVLTPNAQTEQQTVPWYWNPDVRIAIAPDIHCFEAGKEYEHGGVSPQECVLPLLRVTKN